MSLFAKDKRRKQVQKTEAVVQRFAQPSMKSSLIATMLQMAVPLRVMQLRDKPWEYIQKRAKECGEVLQDTGEAVLFRVDKKGETARAFNALAEAVACLSFVPGGVTVFECHWEHKLNEPVRQDQTA